MRVKEPRQRTRCWHGVGSRLEVSEVIVSCGRRPDSDPGPGEVPPRTRRGPRRGGTDRRGDGAGGRAVGRSRAGWDDPSRWMCTRSLKIDIANNFDFYKTTPGTLISSINSAAFWSLCVVIGFCQDDTSFTRMNIACDTFGSLRIYLRIHNCPSTEAM